MGVDPMNFTVRRILRKPAAPAAFRILVGVLVEGKWFKVKVCV
jgi:hypothetical protein